MTVLNENYSCIALIKQLSPFSISIMLSQFSRKYPNKVDYFSQHIPNKQSTLQKFTFICISVHPERQITKILTNY